MSGAAIVLLALLLSWAFSGRKPEPEDDDEYLELEPGDL